MKLVFQRCGWLAWLFTVVLAAKASALPLMDAEALTVSTGFGSETLTTYRDHENEYLYWWFPYRFAVSRTPGLNTPRVFWSEREPDPTLTIVSSTVLRPFQTAHYIRSQLAEARGVGLEQITLRSLTIRGGRLELQLRSLQGGMYFGEYRPGFTLLAQNLTDQIVLDLQDNATLLQMYSVGAGAPGLVVRLRLTVEGQVNPAYLSRTATGSCVGKVLLGSNPAARLGKVVKSTRLQRAVHLCESLCVTDKIDRGPVSVLDIAAAWKQSLEDSGLLVKSGAYHRVTTDGAVLERFLAEPHLSVEREIESATREFPVALDSQDFDLKPMSELMP